MAETIRVAVVEDDEETLRLIRLLLAAERDIRLAMELSWVSVAMNTIGDLQKEGIAVVTLDRDIFGGDIVKRGFIKQTRKEAPNVKIIGLSCCSLEDTDRDLGKCRLAHLPQTIREVLGK
jgi:hypothetical protein